MMRMAKDKDEQWFLNIVRKVPVDPDPDTFDYQHHLGAWLALHYKYGWSVEELAEQMEDAHRIRKEKKA